MPYPRRFFIRTLAAAMAAAGGYLLTRAHSSSPPPFDRKDTIRAVFAQGAPMPVLGPAHLALIRLTCVMWVPVEEGAPGIDIERPLLGTGPIIAIAMAVLKTKDEAWATRTLAELGLLIGPFIQHASLVPGRYAVPAAMRRDFAFPESGVDDAGDFTFRKEHHALLRSAQWRVVDNDSLDEVFDDDHTFWPMPHIDGKRPYGDRSYYQIDMAEVLGQPYRFDANGDLVDDADKDARLERLHGETLAALQIFLGYATLSTTA